MVADPAPRPRQPAPPILSKEGRSWFVTGMCPDGVVRRIGPIARKGDAIMLMLRLSGILALGEPTHRHTA